MIGPTSKPTNCSTAKSGFEIAILLRAIWSSKNLRKRVRNRPGPSTQVADARSGGAHPYSARNASTGFTAAVRLDGM